MLESVKADKHICQGLECEKPATLHCPTCLKLSIKESYFCSQDCFKKNWATHKLVHRSKQGDYDPFSNFTYTGPLRAQYPLSPMRTLPDRIRRPDYAADGNPYSEQAIKGNTRIEVLNDEDIEKMRTVCRLAREVLEIAAAALKPGVTTDEIDRVVHEACVARDSYPSPLNYYCFPKSCCTSVNEVICHGIPDRRPLKDGDIVNIDITLYHQGFHGDLNETYTVGNVDEKGKKLIDVTRECLTAAIAAVKPGVPFRDIGAIIEKRAKADGFAVVRSYCGHGIHRLFHCPPNVPHYAKNKAVGVMKPGQVFTIEPMICEGTWRDQMWPDNWTAVTADGKRSAQFEHTLLVTETGVEILTAALGQSRTETS